MYTIGYFVYGVKINFENLPEEVLTEELDDWIDRSSHQFLSTRYSGSGDQPTYFGTDIATIDEVRDYSWEHFEKIHSKVTPDIIADYEKKKAKTLADPDFPEALHGFLKQPAGLFLTWGTS